jgi:hypothetical protein
MISAIGETGQRLDPGARRTMCRAPDSSKKGTDVDDLDTAPPKTAPPITVPPITVPPIGAATRESASHEPQFQERQSPEPARDVVAWDLVHRAVADAAKARGVRALLRSTDGDFRITADRVNGELILTIEARREGPSSGGRDEDSAETRIAADSARAE